MRMRNTTPRPYCYLGYLQKFRKMGVFVPAGKIGESPDFSFNSVFFFLCLKGNDAMLFVWIKELKPSARQKKILLFANVACASQPTGSSEKSLLWSSSKKRLGLLNGKIKTRLPCKAMSKNNLTLTPNSFTLYIWITKPNSRKATSWSHGTTKSFNSFKPPSILSLVLSLWFAHIVPTERLASASAM